MKKEFTIYDLRNGMVVEYRDGRRQIYVNGSLFGLDSFCEIKYYNDDLTYYDCISSDKDICSIYETVPGFNLKDIFVNKYGLKEIWKQEENVCLKKLKPGDSFKFKGFEWIVLDNNVDDGVMAIMTSTWNGKEHFFDEDGCNNYAKSSLRRKLLDKLLPILGEDNLIPHEVDLVADNGDDCYGTVTDKVFILSCDEYRKYRKFVPLFSEWMWTCTPWYISNSGGGHGVRFVDAGGILHYSGTGINNGVAPTCVFKKDVVAEEVNKDD